jgi:hypothetical protein
VALPPAISHKEAAESIPDPSGPGTVVLDIGGEVGAAVVLAPASLEGTEIEIAGVGLPWDGTHTMIRARAVDPGVVHAGVFDTLRAGRYLVRVRRAGPHGVTGAQPGVPRPGVPEPRVPEPGVPEPRVPEPGVEELEVHGGCVTYARLGGDGAGSVPAV